jgi:hypothetical protein
MTKQYVMLNAAVAALYEAANGARAAGWTEEEVRDVIDAALEDYRETASL